MTIDEFQKAIDISKAYIGWGEDYLKWRENNK